jgi:hypothetical protein
MKFIILKLDCNHDIWVIEGGKCYLYSLIHQGHVWGVSLLFFLGSPNKGNSIFNFNLGAN